MKEYRLSIKVGDVVEVGRFRNVTTKIKNIKLDKNGQPVIVTSKGDKKSNGMTIYGLKRMTRPGEVESGASFEIKRWAGAADSTE